MVLQAVVSLKLVERKDGEGLIAAVEILRQTPRVSKLIFEGNFDTLEEEIENSVSYHRMQSMNQSLAALVLNGVIDKETALGASSRPNDLDLMLRKFLYAGEKHAAGEGEAMVEPLSDYSRIVELQEVRKLYDDLQERHRQDLADRDSEIARLTAALAQHADGSVSTEGEIGTLRSENERLGRQLQLLRQEYEAKIERLNARVREMSGTPPPAAPVGEAERKGFFRR
jgi:hypothetical protein